MLRVLKRALLLTVLIISPVWAAMAEEVREVGWAHLIPPNGQAESLKSKSFLGGGRPSGRSVDQPTRPVPEAEWMSLPGTQSEASTAPSVVSELDGKRIRIGGYVVPLDFDMTKVKQFLLVPYVGACIHVPPPPPNQIIYVEAKEAFEVGGQFDPVYVTGTIRTRKQSTGLAETGYSMDADAVSPWKQ